MGRTTTSTQRLWEQPLSKVSGVGADQRSVEAQHPAAGSRVPKPSRRVAAVATLVLALRTDPGLVQMTAAATRAGRDDHPHPGQACCAEGTSAWPPAFSPWARPHVGSARAEGCARGGLWGSYGEVGVGRWSTDR